MSSRSEERMKIAPSDEQQESERARFVRSCGYDDESYKQRMKSCLDLPSDTNGLCYVPGALRMPARSRMSRAKDSTRDAPCSRGENNKARTSPPFISGPCLCHLCLMTPRANSSLVCRSDARELLAVSQDLKPLFFDDLVCTQPQCVHVAAKGISVAREKDVERRSL